MRSGRNRVEEASEEEEPQEEEGGEAMDVDEEDNADSEVTHKANDLVRLALFMEHKRAVLRRDDINKKVLGPNARSFNRVFELAQKKLREVFGMELVELPTRAGLEKDGNEEGADEPRLETGLKKKANALGSKSYIIRSCLDPALIELAAQTDEDVLAEEAGDQGTLYPSALSDDEGDGGDDEDGPPKFYGSLIAWSRADQLGSTGILYVILALLLANGRVMSDMDLRRHLKTLHLSSNPASHPVKFNASATVRALTLDTYLSTLLRQGYLDRQQIGGEAAKKGKKSGAGSKRLRTQAEDLEEGRMYEWRWGARAFCEVGEEAVAKFIAQFMVESEGDGEEEGRDARRQEELMKKMYKGIEKAAGGKLTELK
ncbi:unnamed protein product [Cyclocybe aegerita]|uniref:MAGE domain-containing protein n=1 Tax=Cyclocybe aegerita TaxID=1973307 RepID=A0A8S0WSI5_CYCAE|nr:unnamed protein product [Cyclocybe aegerita]